jgi:hypothetical protein
MKRRRLLSRIILVLLTAILLSACAHNVKSIRKPSETTEVSEEAPTSITSAKPTPTPKPTARPTATPKPTVKPTPTSTPTPTPNPLEDYFLQEGFLLKDVSAKNSDSKDVLLKSGSLICIFGREEEIIDETSRFFLTDYYTASSSDRSGKEVFFEITENRLGAVCFSGIPEHELFGTEKSIASGKKMVVEVELGTQVSRTSEAERYVMLVDWDRDGYQDELAFEVIDERYSAEVICYFKSGRDGSSIRVRLSPDPSDEEFDNSVDPETLTLTQKQNGEYLVLICADMSTYMPCSYPMETCALSYNPQDVFSKTGIWGGLFEYQDGVLYVCEEGRFFAWHNTTKTAVQLNDDLSCSHLSGTDYFLNYSMPYTYSLQEVNIQMEKDSKYTSEILPAGTLIIPDRLELDASDEGFLYVRLVDGRVGRIKAEIDEEVSMLDGKPDYEVFFFIVGG